MAHFTYRCRQCGERATKPPCGEETKGKLGTWECHNCGKGVKVERRPVKDNKRRATEHA